MFSHFRLVQTYVINIIVYLYYMLNIIYFKDILRTFLLQFCVVMGRQLISNIRSGSWSKTSWEVWSRTSVTPLLLLKPHGWAHTNSRMLHRVDWWMMHGWIESEWFYYIFSRIFVEGEIKIVLFISAFKPAIDVSLVLH